MNANKRNDFQTDMTRLPRYQLILVMFKVTS
ncbi:MAG: hypothetical protein ACJAYC_003402 [Halieaceae bacterium]|jgi:hypothetical protein